LDGDVFRGYRGERVVDLDAHHAHRGSIQGGHQAMAPGRHLVDIGGNLDSTLEHPEIGQPGNRERPAGKWHAKGDQLVAAGSDRLGGNQLHAHAAAADRQGHERFNRLDRTGQDQAQAKQETHK
jgi:hypothetical protein